MSKHVLNVFLLKQVQNVCFCNNGFTKNTFKTRFWLGTRELQKNPDIYEFFPIQWCRFQNFFGSKKNFFLFFLKTFKKTRCWRLFLKLNIIIFIKSLYFLQLFAVGKLNNFAWTCFLFAVVRTAKIQPFCTKTLYFCRHSHSENWPIFLEIVVFSHSFTIMNIMILKDDILW